MALSGNMGHARRKRQSWRKNKKRGRFRMEAPALLPRGPNRPPKCLPDNKRPPPAKAEAPLDTLVRLLLPSATAAAATHHRGERRLKTLRVIRDGRDDGSAEGVVARGRRVRRVV